MVTMLRPAAPLRDFVRCYVHNEHRLPDRTVIQPVAARTGPIIEFTFGDPYHIALNGRSDCERAHPIAVIGSQTFRRVELAMRGHVETLVVIFEPSGLSRLFSLPLQALTNRHFDGVAMFGRTIDELADRLSGCSSFAERAEVVDRYLLRRSAAGTPLTPIAAAAKDLLRQHGSGRIADLAARTGLSLRQFERRFMAEIGVAPKMYARIARFEAALNRKTEFPHMRWTDVAHDLGYHDQMHLVRDFREFSTSTPAAMAPELQRFSQLEFGAAAETTSQPPF
jgi:AraC-like DNA-binding protein